jgi:hypothetical protein
MTYSKPDAILGAFESLLHATDQPELADLSMDEAAFELNESNQSLSDLISAMGNQWSKEQEMEMSKPVFCWCEKTDTIRILPEEHIVAYRNPVDRLWSVDPDLGVPLDMVVKAITALHLNPNLKNGTGLQFMAAITGDDVNPVVEEKVVEEIHKLWRLEWNSYEGLYKGTPSEIKEMLDSGAWVDNTEAEWGYGRPDSSMKGVTEGATWHKGKTPYVEPQTYETSSDFEMDVDKVSKSFETIISIIGSDRWTKWMEQTEANFNNTTAIENSDVILKRSLANRNDFLRLYEGINGE